MPVIFLQQNIYNAVYQENAPKAECDSYLIIRGSSNINQFQFISYQPETINSENLRKNKTYRNVKIPVNSFTGSNKRIIKDFNKMLNAEEYPFIKIAIERREFAKCVGKKGLTNFKTEITVAGNSNFYKVPCAVYACQKTGYIIEGNLDARLTDFEIDPPKKFFGLVKVNDEINIQYVFWFPPENI